MAASRLAASALCVAAALAGAVEAAVLIVRHYPSGDGLERLYAGIFLGFAAGVAVLCASLFAPGAGQACRRACLWLLVLTPALWWGRAG